MIIDAKAMPAGTTLESDICIVGGGPAGLTVASQFLDLPVRITMLETGNLSGDAASQDLLDGEDLTGEYGNPKKYRHSQLGGTVGVWNAPCDGELGAKYVPLDAIDFEARPGFRYSGWPITRADLNPFYARAHRLCGLGPFRFESEDWADLGNQPFALKSDEVVSKVYQLAGRSSLMELITVIKNSPKAQCLINLTATEMVLGQNSSSVVGIRGMAFKDKSVFVKSRLFILAAGGIENARLLLLSKDKHPEGIGNAYDVVGRYFMDHPVYFFTELLPTSPELFRRAGFYDLRKKDGTWILGRLTLSEKALRENEILNLSAVLYPKPPKYRAPGVESLRQMRLSYRSKSYSSAAKFLPNSIFHCADIIRFAAHRRRNPELDGQHFWQAEALKGRKFGTFEPEFYLEQPPDPENRVVLSAERDALNLPKVAVQWRWGNSSRQSAERAANIFARVLETSGLGRLRRLKHPRLNASGHHHMGTTRMHNDPKFGVVDANCKVHGMENLFISGSSVFPTGGYANPTLTIVALALRLADELKPRLI